MPTPAEVPHLPTATEANSWLERGHACSATGDLTGALACYERARETCRQMVEPELYPLGLAWMNRGNALQRLARPGDNEAAIDAYDQALAVFSSIAHRPEVARSIGATWLNRGRVHFETGDLSAAKIDFRRALDRLRPFASDGNPVAVRNLAGAAVNLAQALLADAAAAPEVLALAGEVRLVLGPQVSSDVAGAALSLEASRFELVVRERELSRENVGEFTDVLECALALAAAWLPRDHFTAAPLAARLFHLGAVTYARCQPQFLLEYLRDGLDRSIGPAPFGSLPECHDSAGKVIATLRDEIDRPRLLRADDLAAHHLAALRRDLSAPMPWLRPYATAVPSA